MNSRTYKSSTSQLKHHHRVPEALVLDCIYSRENKIEFAHSNSLEQLFDSPITNFRACLEMGKGIYWISGLVYMNCKYVPDSRLPSPLLMLLKGRQRQVYGHEIRLISSRNEIWPKEVGWRPRDGQCEPPFLDEKGYLHRKKWMVYRFITHLIHPHPTHTHPTHPHSIHKPNLHAQFARLIHILMYLYNMQIKRIN